jgi:hypothetical protein
MSGIRAMLLSRSHRWSARARELYIGRGFSAAFLTSRTLAARRAARLTIVICEPVARRDRIESLCAPRIVLANDSRDFARSIRIKHLALSPSAIIGALRCRPPRS